MVAVVVVVVVVVGVVVVVVVVAAAAAETVARRGSAASTVVARHSGVEHLGFRVYGLGRFFLLCLDCLSYGHQAAALATVMTTGWPF